MSRSESQPCHAAATAAGTTCPYCDGRGTVSDDAIRKFQHVQNALDPAVSLDSVPDEPLRWSPTEPEYPVPPGCRRAWVPFRGWIDIDDDIRRRVDQFFNVPMLTLAVLILPLLVLDYYLSRHGNEHHQLELGVFIAHIAISLAFLVEFVVKVSIAQSRFSYVVKNWLDLIIIVLPFLRTLRILRAARALEAARVLQLSRVYAMRGVGIKAFRTMVPLVLGLRFVQRFQRKKDEPPEAIDYSKWPRGALLHEVKRLSARVEQLEAEAAAAPLAAGEAKAGPSDYHGTATSTRDGTAVEKPT